MYKLFFQVWRMLWLNVPKFYKIITINFQLPCSGRHELSVAPQWLPLMSGSPTVATINIWRPIVATINVRRPHGGFHELLATSQWLPLMFGSPAVADRNFWWPHGSHNVWRPHNECLVVLRLPP